MAKIAFSKLDKKKIKNITPIKCTCGGESIEIIQYLPMGQKVKMMQSIIEQAGDNEEGFYNIVKLQVFYVIEMIKGYTNISFTDTQLSDPAKLYDSIAINQIWEVVKSAIPEDERNYIWDNTCALAREITNYNHSIMGVLKLAKQDYGNAEYNIAELMNQIKDPEVLGLIREITPLVNAE